MNPLVKIAAVLFTVAPLAGALPALAQAAPTVAAKAGGPRITFSETVFDFGKVKSSDVLRHDFIVTNTGNALLEISNVTPACGCTLAGSWDRQIQPGETGRIPIQFSPANFDGTVTKSITVTCNDPAQATPTLQIQASIWHPIAVQPANVHFTPIEGEATNDTKVVRITSNLDQPLTLELPQSSNPAFKLEVKTVKPGKEFELHVTYAGLVSNVTLQTAVEIKTSSPELPAIKFSATVMPQPALAAIPPQITLTPAQLSAGHQHFQMISNSSSVPIQLTAATVNAEGVAVEITEARPGKVFSIKIDFPPNFQAGPGQPLALTIHTSNPKHRVIVVPIEQATAPSAPAPAGSK
ncbi:MAG: DUF1573 domain-containing protein [Opitutaceae bacterium]|nr:DUF1573 domain-containing protein [Opitutaceae bacterium]